MKDKPSRVNKETKILSKYDVKIQKKRVTEVNNSYFKCKTINFDIDKIREEYEVLEKKIQETDFEISKLNSIEFEVEL